MRKVLNQQIEHLTKLEELSSYGNQVLGASNIELQSISQDLSDITGKLDTILASSKEKDIKDSDSEKRKETEEKEKTKESESKESKTIDELQKIREVLSNHNTTVAEKALDDPAYHTFESRMDSLNEMFTRIGDSFKNKDTGKTTVGSTFAGLTKGFKLAVSKNARNREEYIKTERAYGNTLPESKLEEQYKEQQHLLYLNNKNERNLNEQKGNLTKEQFLKLDSPLAQKYKEQQQKIGKRLSEIDSRYKPESNDESSKTESKFSESITTLTNVINKMDSKVEPMVSANTDIESKLETDRSTKLFQDNQLKSMSDQNKILDDSLKVQNLILEELKKRTNEIVDKTKDKETPEVPEVPAIVKKIPNIFGRKPKGTGKPSPTGRPNPRRRFKRFGIAGAVASTVAGSLLGTDDMDSDVGTFPDIVPEERFPKPTTETPKPTTPEVPKPTTPEVPKSTTETPKPTTPEVPKSKGSILDKAKDVIKKVPGASVLKNAGKMALRLAGPVGLALTTYEVGSEAINAYDESFGEGGKKVVQDLHHKKIISYNFGDSEVLDWKGIEDLPTTDLQKLINAKIRFKPEDEAKLHEVLNHKLITGDTKESNITPNTQETQVVPEAIKPETDGTKVIPEAIKPETITPQSANVVYERSAEVDKKPDVVPNVVNNISAPTNNVTQSQQPAIRVDPRNSESTVSRLFGNRNSFY